MKLLFYIFITSTAAALSFHFPFFNYTDSKTLRVLAPTNTLPEDILESYGSEQRIVFSLQTYTHPSQIAHILSNRSEDFDLIISEQGALAELISQNKLMKLNPKDIQNFTSLSKDFKTDQNPEYQYAIPLSWELNVTNSNSQFLQINSIAISKKSSNQSEAVNFLNFLLQKEVAIELTNITKKSGTLATLENTSIEDSLKPSYLRKQKLQNIAMKKK